MKRSRAILSILIGLFPMLLFSQNTKQMTASEVAELALQNQQQLKISAQGINIAKQQVEIAKLQKLPDITASTTQYYLGNSWSMDKDFSNINTIKMPHYGSTYGVQATQLIFKDGLVKKTIELAGLQEQLSQLDLEIDKQDVKLLVISNYLDIYRIINQERVFENNKKLAETRLKNIRDFYKQGMLTRNEIIRGELNIKNLDQGILTLVNNKKILNYNLSIALGLPLDTEILPTEPLNDKGTGMDLMYYIDLAHNANPALKAAKTHVEVSEKNIEIINTDKMPKLSGYGGYNMQRPITSRSPALDMYASGWQSGISLSYNIDNLFKTKKRLTLGKLQQDQANQSLVLVQQNIDMAVNAAYVKYQEAIQQAEILKDAERLANENYKITEAKYLNQLVVQAEMLDAQNQKLQSELDFANAEVNILYQYYNLLKATGTL